MTHRTMEELKGKLDVFRESPTKQGTVDQIVCRPEVGTRKVLTEGVLDEESGLVGDCWKTRGSSRSPDRSALKDAQLTLMNSRVIDAIAPSKEQWSLAGDQFFVDFDLSPANIPPGTRLKLGQALIEVTAEPHLGCRKFKDRFGRDAVLFVNSAEGKAINARGVNARIIQPGLVTTGDSVSIVSDNSVSA